MWQQVSEALPDFETIVLVADSRYVSANGTPLARLSQRTWSNNVKRDKNGFIDTGDGFKVDHWMTIPKMIANE